MSCQAQDRTDKKIRFSQNSTEIATPNTQEKDSSSNMYADAPSVITRNILQDKNGIIWFATFEGIISYDGASFSNLTKGQPIRFFSVLEDRHGHLWFGSIGYGVYRYDGSTLKSYTTQDGLVDDRVTNIYEDEIGKLWFGTTGGISVYDGNSFTNYTLGDGLLDNDVNSIIQDKSGLYWIGTRGKAFTYDGYIFAEITNDEGDSFYNVRDIAMDSRGHIWMGGNDGLWRYNGEHYMRITPDFTGYIYEDIVGNIWTSSVNSTLQGWTLNQYDSISINNLRPMSTQVLTDEGMFFGIIEDTDHNIWVGKLDGVYRLSEEGDVQDFKAQ